MPQQHYPSRVVDVDSTRRAYGDRVDAVLPWLWVADPLADNVAAAMRTRPASSENFYQALEHGRQSAPALPAPMERFLDNVEAVPEWVDWSRINRAGTLFFRTGIAGGIVLGAKSLCYGYCSPGGNKPLIMTGRLSSSAMSMRLVETSRYVVETCRSGGLQRFGRGFQLAIRVRLMHAVVRNLLQSNPAWSNERWGVPINQHDMLGTALLFSQSFVEGIRQFGFSVSTTEAEDYLHLWRYATYLMGLDESLFPKDEADALVLADIILRTQGAPDADARTLVDALVRAPLSRAEREHHRVRGAAAQVAAGYGFCRTLLGPELSDALALPKDKWRFAIPAISKVVAALEPIRERVPALEHRLAAAGHRHWERAITQGSQGQKTTFAPPTRLAGLKNYP